MDIFTFVDLAKEYARLGTAVQEQLDDILADIDADTVRGQNANAVRHIERFLKKVAPHIADDFSDDVPDILTAIHEAQKDE
jgi:hypothetical protein